MHKDTYSRVFMSVTVKTLAINGLVRPLLELNLELCIVTCIVPVKLNFAQNTGQLSSIQMMLNVKNRSTDDVITLFHSQVLPPAWKIISNLRIWIVFHCR